MIDASATATPEQWRSVPGFEGRYEVSDHGNVRSLLTDRVLRPGAQSRGYLTVYLALPVRPKKQVSHLVHDLVARAFIGPRPEKLQVNHIDGCKTNNALSNLEYVTQRENNQHAASNGLCPWVKLTPEKVQKIRAAAFRYTILGYVKRATYVRRVRRVLGVGNHCINELIRGKTWRNVAPLNYEPYKATP